MAAFPIISNTSESSTPRLKSSSTECQILTPTRFPSGTPDITNGHSSTNCSHEDGVENNATVYHGGDSWKNWNSGRSSRPCSELRTRNEESPGEVDVRLGKMCEAVRTLLECVGEDPNREGLFKTPLRYAKALLDLTKGYGSSVEGVVNNALFHEERNGMVIVKDIKIHSLCEHHLLPFTGKIHIGYMPTDTVIGLSKLPRIAEVFSHRLQVQERLTNEIAKAVMDVANPLGVVAVMESSHLCMAMRGVEQPGSTTTTICALGCFKKDHRLRNEFLSLVGMYQK